LGLKCKSRLEVNRFLKGECKFPFTHFQLSYASASPNLILSLTLLLSKIKKVFYEIEETIAETEGREVAENLIVVTAAMWKL
jgi:hypothetical protein